MELRMYHNSEITVHHIRPQFESAEAMERIKIQISQLLYRVFSRYNLDEN